MATCSKILSFFIVTLALGFSAFAADCQLDARGRDTIVRLNLTNIRYDDSIGIDYGGHNFKPGYAVCDDQEVAIAKSRVDSRDGQQVVLVIQGRYDYCEVSRSQNWHNTFFACGQRRPVQPHHPNQPHYPNQPQYMGCFTDQANRSLPVQLSNGGSTVESCISAAKSRGLAYAGLQYGGQCYGGNRLNGNKVSDRECNTPCTSDRRQTCGGTWRNSVYSTRGH